MPALKRLESQQGSLLTQQSLSGPSLSGFATGQNLGCLDGDVTSLTLRLSPQSQHTEQLHETPPVVPRASDLELTSALCVFPQPASPIPLHPRGWGGWGKVLAKREGTFVNVWELAPH